MKHLVFIALVAFFLTACSNPEEEAKKLGFSDVAEMTALQKEGFKSKSEYTKKMEEEAKKNGFNTLAEMKEMQSKGFKTKGDYDASLLTAAKSYAKCTAQVGIFRQLAQNNGHQGKAAQAYKLFQGLVYIQPDYINTLISKDEIRKLISTEYNSFKAEVEAMDVTFEFLDKGIYDCEKQYLPKINEACRGKESTCFAEPISPGKDPKKLADELQIAGVSRCIAAATVMSAGFVSNPNIKSDGPEIRSNNALMKVYGAARVHIIQSMNNPGAISAIDDMVRQQADYFGNIVKFQGWGAFMPEYKQCQTNAN